MGFTLIQNRPSRKKGFVLRGNPDPSFEKKLIRTNFVNRLQIRPYFESWIRNLPRLKIRIRILILIRPKIPDLREDLSMLHPLGYTHICIWCAEICIFSTEIYKVNIKTGLMAFWLYFRTKSYGYRYYWNYIADFLLYIYKYLFVWPGETGRSLRAPATTTPGAFSYLTCRTGNIQVEHWLSLEITFLSVISPFMSYPYFR